MNKEFRMPIALIIGGNKGLGKAAARRLVELGHTVYIGARDAERGRSAAEELGAQWILLDVTDDASAAAAAELTGREGKLVRKMLIQASTIEMIAAWI